MKPDEAWEDEAAAMVALLGRVPPRIAEALRRIPRHRFVPMRYRSDAYADEPLPSGHGESTISAPHMVALQLEWLELRPGLRVLEVGSGTGYVLALLADLTAPDGRVVGVEIDGSLAAEARERLRELGLSDRVEIVVDDGSVHLPSGPFDRVLVSCATPEIYRVWKRALTPDGSIVAPVGDRESQTLARFRARAVERIEWGPVCRFVALLHASRPNI